MTGGVHAEESYTTYLSPVFKVPAGKDLLHLRTIMDLSVLVLEKLGAEVLDLGFFPRPARPVCQGLDWSTESVLGAAPEDSNTLLMN